MGSFYTQPGNLFAFAYLFHEDFSPINGGLHLPQNVFSWRFLSNQWKTPFGQWEAAPCDWRTIFMKQSVGNCKQINYRIFVYNSNSVSCRLTTRKLVPIISPHPLDPCYFSTQGFTYTSGKSGSIGQLGIMTTSCSVRTNPEHYVRCKGCRDQLSGVLLRTPYLLISLTSVLYSSGDSMTTWCGIYRRQSSGSESDFHLLMSCCSTLYVLT